MQEAGNTAVGIPPRGLLGFFLIATLLALLLALAEIAAAFHDTSFSPWKAVLNRWAWPLYGLYALLTALIGLVLFENRWLPLS